MSRDTILSYWYQKYLTFLCSRDEGTIEWVERWWRNSFYPSLFFLFFFQTKFICSLLIKGSIVRSSLCIIEQYFYSRDFIIKNRVLSGWIVQMENFILFFLGWNFWNIYFWRFSFFFFLRLNFCDWSTVRWKLLGRRGKWNKCGDGFREFYLARSISHSGRKIVRRLSNENSIQKDLHIRF